MGAAPARQRNVRVVNRTAIVAVVCLALLAGFAAIALSVVNVRRPLDAKLTRSFASVASRTGGTRAVVSASACQKESVAFFDCSANVAQRGRGASVYVAYHVWLDDDGCWDTKRRTRRPQPAALGPLRARFYALRGCIAR